MVSIPQKKEGNAMKRSVVILAAVLGWAAAGFMNAAFAEQPDKWVRYVEAKGLQ